MPRATVKVKELSSAKLNMAVKKKTETGSGIFVPGNINSSREMNYKAIYGSYEKHLKGQETALASTSKSAGITLDQLKDWRFMASSPFSNVVTIQHL